MSRGAWRKRGHWTRLDVIPGDRGVVIGVGGAGGDGWWGRQSSVLVDGWGSGSVATG